MGNIAIRVSASPSSCTISFPADPLTIHGSVTQQKAMFITSSQPPETDSIIRPLLKTAWETSPAEHFSAGGNLILTNRCIIQPFVRKDGVILQPLPMHRGGLEPNRRIDSYCQVTMIVANRPCFQRDVRTSFNPTDQGSALTNPGLAYFDMGLLSRSWSSAIPRVAAILHERQATDEYRRLAEHLKHEKSGIRWFTRLLLLEIGEDARPTLETFLVQTDHSKAKSEAESLLQELDRRQTEEENE